MLTPQPQNINIETKMISLKLFILDYQIVN